MKTIVVNPECTRVILKITKQGPEFVERQTDQGKQTPSGVSVIVERSLVVRGPDEHVMDVQECSSFWPARDTQDGRLIVLDKPAPDPDPDPEPEVELKSKPKKKKQKFLDDQDE